MFGKKNKNQKKQWIIGFCGLLVIGVAGGMLAAKMTTSVSDTEKTAKDTAGQDSVEEDSLTDTITWKGEKYRYNDHLSNFLFLGIDTREKIETNVGHADAGQSDALYLLSGTEKRIQLLQSQSPEIRSQKLKHMDRAVRALEKVRIISVWRMHMVTEVIKVEN